MRRKVWVAVFGLLVLAVVAQSMVLVERRSSGNDWEFQVGPNGRTYKIKSGSSRRFAPEPSNLVLVNTTNPTEQDIEKARKAFTMARSDMKKVLAAKFSK